MSRVEEIKAAIDQLSAEERCELNSWLNPQPDDDWDEQMQADANAGGKLHRLMLEAEADAEAGRLTDFPKRNEG
jgi:uncharacterized protein with von Willebrand factor type A (vWA) domain